VYTFTYVRMHVRVYVHTYVLYIYIYIYICRYVQYSTYVSTNECAYVETEASLEMNTYGTFSSP